MDRPPVARRVALGTLLLLPACSGATKQTEDHADVPSRQLVTFRLSNLGASDLWLPLRGTICQELTIDTAAGRELRLIPFEGMCCTCGVAASYVEYTPLAPGAETTVTWDAREFFEYSTGDSCTPTGSFAKPVSAGPYVARLQAVRSAPVGSTCSAAGDGRVNCESCEPAVEMRVPFTLPSSGDVLVPVGIQ